MPQIVPSKKHARFWYQDGLEVKDSIFEYPVSNMDQFQSCFLFSFHKSGSVLVFNMLNDMCREANIPSVSLPDMLFLQGISTNSCLIDYASFFEPTGYLYSGFRGMPESMHGVMQSLAGPKALVVRDPRDMLVSLYYSVKFSHYFPENVTAQFAVELDWEKKATLKPIDLYCLERSALYIKEFNQIRDLVGQGAKVFRYEEFIYDKAGLCLDLRRHFQIPVPESIAQAIASRYDEIPTAEQSSSHIRQVHPGDHRRKLAPETIEILTKTFEDFLKQFGYD